MLHAHDDRLRPAPDLRRLGPLRVQRDGLHDERAVLLGRQEHLDLLDGRQQLPLPERDELDDLHDERDLHGRRGQRGLRLQHGSGSGGLHGRGHLLQGLGDAGQLHDGRDLPRPTGKHDHACPANQTCKGAGLGGACSCDDTCTAAQSGGGVGTYCTSTTSQQTCTRDPNSCHIASNPVPCLGVQTCRGADGAGSCQCPAQGVTAGAGCSLEGQSSTICQGNNVLICTSDAASACLYWVPKVDCSMTSLVCGTKAGGGTIAGCQCAEHAGTDYFVDPAAGQDTSTLFPTGIDSPADCRFGTLGKGLSVAAAGGRVIATSAAPPVSFSGEAFPLIVPASVTLTTADAVLTPGNYQIAFNSGGAGAALSLGTSSTFEGFSVVNTNGAAAGSAISLASAGVTVDAVDLDGNGLATGINVVGAGQGLLNAVKVEGFTTGVNIAPTTSGPPRPSRTAPSSRGTRRASPSRAARCPRRP